MQILTSPQQQSLIVNYHVLVISEQIPLWGEDVAKSEALAKTAALPSGPNKVVGAFAFLKTMLSHQQGKGATTYL